MAAQKGLFFSRIQGEAKVMKSKVVVLYVFRHGETDWNRDMRWQGHTNIPLNATGKKQAHSLIKPLKERGPTHILSSDLARAHETGLMVASALGCDITPHPGFRELGFGEAEGLTFQEIGIRFGEDAQQRIRSTEDANLDFSFPGGESKRQLLKRAFAALDELLMFRDDLKHHEVIGLATHGGLIRTFLQLCGLKERAQVSIPNGSLFHFEYHGPTGHLVFKGKIDEEPPTGQ
jgi:probable phosphoglycerate mutase